MSTVKIIKTIAIVTTTFLLAACDDNDKTRYQIEIVMTDNIDYKITTIKGDHKPEVGISYPEGVKVTGRETKPGKTVSYGLVPIAIVVLSMIYFAAVGRGRTDHKDTPADACA